MRAFLPPSARPEPAIVEISTSYHVFHCFFRVRLRSSSQHQLIQSLTIDAPKSILKAVQIPRKVRNKFRPRTDRLQCFHKRAHVGTLEVLIRRWACLQMHSSFFQSLSQNSPASSSNCAAFPSGTGGTLHSHARTSRSRGATAEEHAFCRS